MATSRVTPDADAIESEVRIAAPAERVFDALVDSAQVPQWWGQEGIYRCTEFHADLRAGGKCERWEWTERVNRSRLQGSM
jgi:uncharacterized protein YndB with AHSA1/START domain